MICEDMTGKQGGIALKNYWGEWIAEEIQPETPTGSFIGGTYDGSSIDNLPDGTIVYVGAAEDAATYEEATTEAAAEEPEEKSTDLSQFPEFDGIKWFTPQEFFCKCSNQNCVGKGTVHMHHELLVVADRLRDQYGPVTVTSGIRCPAHNAAVGGVTKSRHLEGKAMDFVVNGVSAGTTTNWARCQPEIRYTYAITATATHMDVN